MQCSVDGPSLGSAFFGQSRSSALKACGSGTRRVSHFISHLHIKMINGLIWPIFSIPFSYTNPSPPQFTPLNLQIPLSLQAVNFDYVNSPASNCSHSLSPFLSFSPQPLIFFHSPSLFLSFSLSFSLYIFLFIVSAVSFVPICISLSIYLSIYLSIHLSIYIYIYLSIYLSNSLSIHLSILAILSLDCLYFPFFPSSYSLSLSIYLSIHL